MNGGCGLKSHLKSFLGSFSAISVSTQIFKSLTVLCVVKGRAGEGEECEVSTCDDVHMRHLRAQSTVVTVLLAVFFSILLTYVHTKAQRCQSDQYGNKGE